MTKFDKLSYDQFIDHCCWLYRDLFHKKLPAEMLLFVNSIWISLFQEVIN